MVSPKVETPFLSDKAEARIWQHAAMLRKKLHREVSFTEAADSLLSGTCVTCWDNCTRHHKRLDRPTEPSLPWPSGSKFAPNSAFVDNVAIARPHPRLQAVPPVVAAEVPVPTPEPAPVLEPVCCSRGHELTPTNAMCRRCHNDSSRKSHNKNRAIKPVKVLSIEELSQ